MPITNFGKRMLARVMFDKGRSFLAAGILLDKQNGHKDVVLYLICQGLEILQKALLMWSDVEKFDSRKLKKIGHDLIEGANELSKAYELKPLHAGLISELEALNAYYCEKKEKIKMGPLRYYGIHDMFGGHDLAADRVLKYSISLLKFGDRTFKKLN